MGRTDHLIPYCSLHHSTSIHQQESTTLYERRAIISISQVYESEAVV